MSPDSAQQILSALAPWLQEKVAVTLGTSHFQVVSRKAPYLLSPAARPDLLALRLLPCVTLH